MPPVNFARFRAIRHKFAPFWAVIPEHLIKRLIGTEMFRLAPNLLLWY